MSTSALTTTSYAILGMLAIRPWTTYELAQQMERSLRYYWPRAQSRIYEEPKRLAELGLAKGAQDSVGRRPRTVWSITARGRRALERWLAEPGAGPVLEFESLLKVFFAEHGTTADAAANIDAVRRWAEEQHVRNVEFARLYVETGGPFPERLPVIALTGKFVSDLTDMLASWSAWAAEQVAAWPDEPRHADAALDALREIAARPIPETR